MVKVPSGAKIQPHSHPENRIYTVVSGVFYIGFGDTFDAAKLQVFAPGSVIVLPAKTPHFHWAKGGEYVVQVYGVGPIGMKHPDDRYDLRKVTSRERRYEPPLVLVRRDQLRSARWFNN